MEYLSISELIILIITFLWGMGVVVSILKIGDYYGFEDYLTPQMKRIIVISFFGSWFIFIYLIIKEKHEKKQ